MKILFVGDIVGGIGARHFARLYPEIKKEHGINLTIVNGENSNDGNGIGPADADFLFASGADIITTGNHVYRRRNVYEYLSSNKAIIRPENYPLGNPGRGYIIKELAGTEVAVVNMQGTVFMDALENPFHSIDRVLKKISAPIIIVDFHAEATSEKIAFASYLDGRVTAVLGTHTHVQTADERLLPAGTAFISDVGMTGPLNSSLGVVIEPVIARFRTKMPAQFEVAGGECILSAVVLDIEKSTGAAKSITRLML